MPRGHRFRSEGIRLEAVEVPANLAGSTNHHPMHPEVPPMERPSSSSPLILLSILLIGAAPEAPRAPTVREVVDQGFRVRLDLGPQVLGIDVLEDRGFGNESGSTEPSISPTLLGAG